MTSSRVLRSPRALWRSVGPEVLVTCSDADGFEVLSETAGDVWLLLEAPLTIGEIAMQLSMRFGEPVDHIAADVERLIGDLRARGYVCELDG